MNENSPILIFALSPRCGSTSLTEAITKSLNTKHILEPFAHKWNSSECIDNTYIKPKPEDIFKLCQNNNIQVIKTIEDHLSEKENKDIINKCKTIFLYRKNFIDVILSIWMSHNYFQKTGIKDVYYINNITQLKDFYTLKRDKINLPYFIDYFYRCKELKNKYILECNINTIISYEEYFNENIIENHNKLINKLGFKILSDGFKTVLGKEKKHNSHNIYKDLIPNYSDVIRLKEKLIL